MFVLVSSKNFFTKIVFWCKNGLTARSRHKGLYIALCLLNAEEPFMIKFNFGKSTSKNASRQIFWGIIFQNHFINKKMAGRTIFVYFEWFKSGTVSASKNPCSLFFFINSTIFFQLVQSSLKKMLRCFVTLESIVFVLFNELYFTHFLCPV